MTLSWYFDFISPYSYLQFLRLPELSNQVRLELKPILFAGLLNHWGQLGPAEIPAKRLFTYRHVWWLARRQGVELNMPHAHPFNPLPLLRLAWAADRQPDAIGTIFRYVWVERGHCSDLLAIDRLGQDLGIDNVSAAISDELVKRDLREAGEEALAAGVFGVPSFVHDDLVLWGQDAPEMISDLLDNPQLFSAEQSRILNSLPATAVRPLL